MPFITQGKTNWRLLLIVIILALIVGVGALWYVKRLEKPYKAVEINKTESADWKNYKNEEYGFEFQFPKDWVSVSFVSKINDDAYVLRSSDGGIIKIFYFKPQKMIAFIAYGENYSSVCPEWSKGYTGSLSEIGPPSSEVLKVLYPNKEIKTIYTSIQPTESDCDDLNNIDEVSLSPNGEYIAYASHIYEFKLCSIVNINTGEQVSNINFYDPYNNVIWSSSNKTLAIISYPCEMEPCGTTQEGIFVSDYGKPEKLNKILSLPPLGFIDNLYFVDDDKLFFSLIKWGINVSEDKFIQYLIRYEYDIKIKLLKELESEKLN